MTCWRSTRPMVPVHPSGRHVNTPIQRIHAREADRMAERGEAPDHAPARPGDERHRAGGEESRAHTDLRRQFEAGTNDKHYLAVCRGTPPAPRGPWSSRSARRRPAACGSRWPGRTDWRRAPTGACCEVGLRADRLPALHRTPAPDPRPPRRHRPAHRGGRRSRRTRSSSCARRTACSAPRTSASSSCPAGPAPPQDRVRSPAHRRTDPVESPLAPDLEEFLTAARARYA